MKKIIMALLFCSSIFAAPRELSHQSEGHNLLKTLPKAVVFDFGGVLTGAPNRESVILFLRETFQLSEEGFEKVNQEKKTALKNGKTDEEFWIGFAREKGVVLPPNWRESFRSVLRDAVGVDSKMYVLVDQIRNKKIPVVVFSNIDDRYSKLIRDLGLYEPFDHCLLSIEIGVEKPDPKAYQVLIERLGLPAHEIVFFDDKSENIEGAKKAGIDAVLFESHDQAQSELKKRELL